MAPVNGRPFIAYLVDYYLRQGIERFIFSLGYMHGMVEDFIRSAYPGLQVQMVVEREPLGTGGAIRLAAVKAAGPDVLVLNGDTFFGIDMHELATFHREMRADCTLSLKPMRDFDRYGVVELDEHGAVRQFREKQFYDEGLINGGVYALRTGPFLDMLLPEKFSFEKDYLEKPDKKKVLCGLVQDAYFIDIGIPEDYHRAMKELPEQIQ